MNFTSTSFNDQNEFLKSNFKNCLLNPLPLKDSLWFPDNIKKLDDLFFENIDKMDFKSIALTVLKNLLNDDIPEENLLNIIEESLNFKIPLIKCDNNMYILELFHGPTFTFKDVGARFMSRILKYYYPVGTENFDIIVSTSGDTGGAVADAFQDLPNVKVHILYPKDMISEVQEKQLTTYGNNVFAYELDGNFDECQDLIKKTLSDKDLTNRMLFFPANSINIARLIPQCLYYFWAYSLLKKETNKKPIICVPSGNLGNLSGGILAYKLGLPVKRFIGATNKNNTFERYIKEGDEVFKNIKRAEPTLSSAMDISIPNNLKRLKYVFRNEKISDLISSYSVSDIETKVGIKTFWDYYNYSIDPHTSVGYQAVNKYKLEKNSEDIFIILSTAHPAKFYKTMDKVLIPYKMPNKIIELLKSKGKSYFLKKNYELWKKVLIKNSFNNITFIGMPFSGKSFLARELSDEYQVLDIDILLEEKHKSKLSDILKNVGTNKFIELEEKCILDLPHEFINTIYSPGGSVIYSEKIMNHFKKISKIIFLDVSFSLLDNRKSEFEKINGDTRGIVYKKDQTFKDLFDERYPLYLKYADIIINPENLDINQIKNIIF